MTILDISDIDIAMKKLHTGNIKGFEVALIFFRLDEKNKITLARLWQYNKYYGIKFLSFLNQPKNGFYDYVTLHFDIAEKTIKEDICRVVKSQLMQSYRTFEYEFKEYG